MSSLIDEIQQKFNPAAAAGMDEVFQFEFKEGDNYYIVIEDGQCQISEGEHDDPSVTLKLSQEVFKNILNGKQNGMTAFMTGKLKAEGNMMLATKLTDLFPA